MINPRTRSQIPNDCTIIIMYYYHGTIIFNIILPMILAVLFQISIKISMKCETPKRVFFHAFPPEKTIKYYRLGQYLYLQEFQFYRKQ